VGQNSGIGVLDKAVLVLRQAAQSPVTLAELIEHVDLPKATAHRIAVALEIHGFLRRNESGAWLLGPLLAELADAAGPDLPTRARPILEQLCRETGESAQLFEREADVRVCTAAADRESGLRDTVPLGARLPMTAGSAAHVLLAWSAGPRSRSRRWPRFADSATHTAAPNARPVSGRSQRRYAAAAAT
jgi:DNA-binding IclR family transcriptional regulator